MPTESQRLIAFHQYSAPMSVLFLCFALVILAIATGIAVIRGAIDGPTFVACLGSFAASLAALVGSTNRGQSRSSDTSTTVTQTTTGTGGTTP